MSSYVLCVPLASGRNNSNKRYLLNRYPFHLRPKNKQLLQYLRMAVDMVHDLELDEAIDTNLAAEPPESKQARFQGIRAYLACFYILSVSVSLISAPFAFA